MAADLESGLLQSIDEAGSIQDTGAYAESHSVDHMALVGVMKSLLAAEIILVEDIDHSRLALTEEARLYLEAGSPEAQVFNAIPESGISLADLKAKLDGTVGDVGFKQAMQQRWVAISKEGGAPLVMRKVPTIQDAVQTALVAVDRGQDTEVAAATVAALKKRKLLTTEAWKTYRLTKGIKFARQRVKEATDLTADMLAKGTWRDAPFKAYNFDALGLAPPSGHLHPLLKVRTAFRKIFVSMGFEEMPTNNYVESSFWNFDALFQPQQHPARDAHDTFFLTYPATTPCSSLPQDYLERVRETHQTGGWGSTGYGYAWQEAEAEKNLLRTHTTAVSSRMLYRLAQNGFRPAKYFSIDRVFRNEAVDRTHLAEFHQIEGVVAGVGLTLGDLIGTLTEFFARLGLPTLRFKPAYNPYTEPSMEIFSYSEQLGKWIEVGNSGMFRPEMLRPMGLPEDVNVIAWGLSLERPTMILYGIDNIRDLFGHKVALSMVKRNPLCRLGL
ncbi:TSF3 [Auxenochlorella protothecoides x Auxenochlorella symbiontica]